MNMYNLWYSLDKYFADAVPYDEEVLENEEFKIVREKIDIHNNSFKRLEKNLFFKKPI